MSQVSRWGNSQGIRIPKKLLKAAGIGIDDKVELVVMDNNIVVKLAAKKTLDWYLEGYDGELDRYEWGSLNDPEGRELV